jgi:hypothetical protein
MSCGAPCDEILEAAGHITGCDCAPTAFPFICDRHGGCEKTEHFFKLCQTHIGLFHQWEAGDRSLCINPPHEIRTYCYGLGDLLEWLLKRLTFGKLKPWPGCQCARRKNELNRRFPLRCWQQ